jgi:hypothetical protein
MELKCDTATHRSQSDGPRLQHLCMTQLAENRLGVRARVGLIKYRPPEQTSGSTSYALVRAPRMAASSYTVDTPVTDALRVLVSHWSSRARCQATTAATGPSSQEDRNEKGRFLPSPCAPRPRQASTYVNLPEPHATSLGAAHHVPPPDSRQRRDEGGSAVCATEPALSQHQSGTDTLTSF